MHYIILYTIYEILIIYSFCHFQQAGRSSLTTRERSVSYTTEGKSRKRQLYYFQNVECRTCINVYLNTYFKICAIIIIQPSLYYIVIYMYVSISYQQLKVVKTEPIDVDALNNSLGLNTNLITIKQEDRRDTISPTTVCIGICYRI